MASPPVQPIRSSRCGIASVTAMELFTGTISLESLGGADQALVARTTALAWTRPRRSAAAGWPERSG